MEVLGIMTLKINEGGYGRINLSIANNEDRNVQFQVVCSYNTCMTRLGLQPVFLISSYGASLAQRASYLALHSSLFGPVAQLIMITCILSLTALNLC